jgi:hypothetical protein
VFADEAVDGFPILELAQQGRKAVGLVIHRKHFLMNDRKSRMACLSQHPGLGNPILEYDQLLGLRAINPEIICDRIGVCLGRTKMRIHTTSLSFIVKARICIQQKGDQKKPTGRRTRQGHQNTYTSSPC